MSKSNHGFLPHNLSKPLATGRHTMSLVKTTTAAALFALASLGVVSHANATIVYSTAPLSISGGTLTIWSGDTSNGQAKSTAEAQQALPSAANDLTKIATGSFSGVLNFVDAGSNTVGGFLSSDSSPITFSSCGSLSTCYGTTLSGANYTHATLLEFDFTAAYTQNVTIAHDDGISLFAGSNTTDLVPVGSSAPTASGLDTVALTGGTTYHLYYSEVNGLPADLTTSVPEPVSMALLGVGMIGTGVVARRRRSTAATR